MNDGKHEHVLGTKEITSHWETFAAYDYDRRAWVQGKDGITVRIAQVERDLGVLTGPRGKEFWAYIGMPADKLPERIEDAKIDLARLKLALLEFPVIHHHQAKEGI